MNYASIRKMDISNGIGIGVSLFVQGCDIHCKGCFNQSTWDFNGGYKWTDEIEEEFLKLADKDYIKRITLLGGECLCNANASDILYLVLHIKHRFPDKAIWIYSGYLYEDLMKDPIKKEILDNCDILVDGPYEEDKRNINLKFRGSSNQRIIDLKKSTPDNIIALDL